MAYQSHAPSSTPGTSRRTILAASGWAAPAILVATATPAFAASETISDMATVNKYNPSVGSNAPGKINLWSAQVWYDANVFSNKPGVGWNNTPPTAIVAWKVYVLDADDNVVGTLVQERTATLNRSGNDTASGGELTGLTSGATYTVVSEIISVTYSPNPYNGRIFLTPGSTARSQITVT